MFKKQDERVVGVPYFVGMKPYQQDVIYGDPGNTPIKQTMYRDTPAPFNCPYCGNSGLTFVRSKLSLAAVVACMMPFMLGFCFLCPTMDCLWHKYHYCPHCTEKESFAIPAG
ncbi:GSH-induced LITAF domain protein-like [Hibiscus syriacus]|uniref:GSH-induced LITAF domain protein-like n=1 Tax=Hibiscus syriacus TaxID=106335 RepID=UPI001920A920|nr:GSH-induced LITAF domain protein-like [Hibiscus syriacus]